MARILIDGYNLIRQVPDLEEKEKLSLENGRVHLLNLLKSYRKYKKLHIYIVFDGQSELSEKGHSFKEGGLEICFSSHPQSADDVIAEILQKRKNNHDTIVVSSDRKVQQYAKDFGAASMPAKDFYNRMSLAIEMDGISKDDGSPRQKKKHKRWATYKKGPKKRLPKKKRQNKNRLKKL